MKHTIYFLLLTAVLFSGCQQGIKPNPAYRIVKGTVTLNGKPVDGATVTFFPADASGLSAGGYTDKEGKYVLTADGTSVAGAGTKPGKYKVTVKKIEMPIDQDQLDYDAGKITQQELIKRQMNQKPQKAKSILPENYADIKKTPLEASVEDKKENVCDLKIEEK